MNTKKILLLALLTLILLPACAQQPINSEEPMNECEVLLQQINDKDFSNWPGLSPKCDAATVAAFGKGNLSTHGSHYKGRKYIPTDFIPLQFSRYDMPARLWFRKDQVVLLELEFPALPDVAKLKASLGAPSAKLNYYFDVLYYQNAEYVYPDRGLTLFFDPSGSEVFKIWVYPPQSLEAYLDNLHFEEAPREFLWEEEKE